MEKVQEPKRLKVFRVLGFLFLIVGIILIVLGTTVFKSEFAGSYMPCLPMMMPGVMLVFVSISCIIIGFSAKIQSAMIKQARYIQDQNKNTLSDMASTQADINSEAITKVTKSIKEGFEDHKYCKHCGAEIDADSRFCPYCGKEQ